MRKAHQNAAPASLPRARSPSNIFDIEAYLGTLVPVRGRAAA
jgi:hypothetical protein